MLTDGWPPDLPLEARLQLAPGPEGQSAGHVDIHRAPRLPPALPCLALDSATVGHFTMGHIPTWDGWIARRDAEPPRSGRACLRRLAPSVRGSLPPQAFVYFVPRLFVPFTWVIFPAASVLIGTLTTPGNNSSAALEKSLAPNGSANPAST